MKKVTVYWTEFYNYSAEMEIPEGLDYEEKVDYAMNNLEAGHKPYEINTDWDSFYIEELEPSCSHEYAQGFDPWPMAWVCRKCGHESS